MKALQLRLDIGVKLPILIFTTFLLTGLFTVLVSQEMQLEDAEITNAIETEFWIDDVIDMNSINVSTENGIVTFTGTVNNILTKDRVVEIAEGIRGVRAIVNTVEVEPAVMRSDNEIRDAVHNALLDDPATDLYEITTTVYDGVVTLEGTVQSWAEKKLVASVAKGVKGVRSIQNNVSIDYEATRSDYEIKQDIEGRLANDVQVDDYLIDVAVEDGQVTLTGTAGSLSEKNRAESDAWVAGVEAVDTSDLNIEWWARDRMRRKEFMSRTDQEIKEAVTDAFTYDPRLLSFNVNVDVDAGTATLTGIVDNLQAKNAAEQDAGNTIGVWRVKNHIQVRPETVPTDEALENKVKTALLEDPYVERYELTIDASNGLVYLDGTVNTSFEKYQAEMVTADVQGVTSIVNNIEYEHEWTWKPDWEIREDVKDQLMWSTFVDEEQVNVTVDDGVVTLTGQVDSWSEFNSAEKNSYQAGAKDVMNNLTVQHRYYGPHYPYNYWGFPY